MTDLLETPIATDEGAEAALLGAVLHGLPWPQGVDAERDLSGRHVGPAKLIQDMHAAGSAVDPQTVASEALRRGLTQFGPMLAELYTACPNPANIDYYAAAVRDASGARRVAQLGIKLQQRAHRRDVAGAFDDIRAFTTYDDPAATAGAAMDVVDFLDVTDDDDSHDWVIDDLVERGDRIIWTGEEGIGKSTLFRQIGYRAAAGEHPFTGAAIKPVRVLLIDLENSERQVRRKLLPFLDYAVPPPGGLHMLIRPDGIDLQQPDDRAWLGRHIAAVRPDLLITGPLYKITGGDPVKEEPAKIATAALDRLRVEYGFALILEAHTPYAANSGKHRPMRPYGASLWSRWPEFGIHLARTGRLSHWRGQRDERDWPAGLSRGDTWPWDIDALAAPTTDDRAAPGLPPAAQRVLALLTDATEPLTVQQIGDQLAAAGHPLKKRTIQDAVNKLGDQIDSLGLDGRGTEAHLLRKEPTT